MKNLTQLASQLAGIWRQLGLNQRISVVTASIMVLAGLASLVWWLARADYKLLYGGLEDGEASKIVSALQETKVPYRLAQGGRSILVPADQVDATRIQLNSRNIKGGEVVGLDLFDKPAFGISDFVQRVNYNRAVQGELSRTISKMEEIDWASVLLVMPENRLLPDNQKRPTASVHVKTKRQAALSPHAVSSIQSLVANAVEGLTSANVVVIDSRLGMVSNTSEPDSLGAISDHQIKIRTLIEENAAKKAEYMLFPVIGVGKALVRVAAEVNFDAISRQERTIDAEAVIPGETSLDEETTKTSNGANGGTAGIGPNLNTDTNATATASSNISETKRKNSKLTNIVPETLSKTTFATGVIKKLSAAVFIASKFEGTGADRKPLPRTPQELLKLKEIVAKAIGLQLTNNTANGTRLDELALEEVPFNEEMATELTQTIDKQQNQQFWWDLGKSVIYPALALGMMLFFYRTLKSTPTENIPIGVPLGLFGNGHGNGNGNGHRSGNGDWRKQQEPALVTVDVLNRLIRENPENVSQAIRSWLTRGGKPGQKNN